VAKEDVDDVVVVAHPLIKQTTDDLPEHLVERRIGIGVGVDSEKIVAWVERNHSSGSRSVRTDLRLRIGVGERRVEGRGGPIDAGFVAREDLPPVGPSIRCIHPPRRRLGFLKTSIM
jgi:hypothetical protein